nr:hypothetical protein [Tanacetum cinerariifolium]
MASMNTKLNIERLNENIVQKHEGSKQVGLKQLGSKQVGSKLLGHKQVGFKQLGPCVETGFHGVQDEKRVWFEVELHGAQEDREAEEQKKVHPGIKVGANIMVTGVSGQEGAEGGPRFEVPTLDEDAEYRLCLSVTPKKTDMFMSGFAKRITNINGKILGNDCKSWMARRCVSFVEKIKDDSCGRIDYEVVTRDNDDDVEVVCPPSADSTAEVPLLNVTPSPILGSAGIQGPKVLGSLQPGTHGCIVNEAAKFSLGYSKPGYFASQSRSIAYGLVDKYLGLTHVDVSCEGYLEHAAETNSMDMLLKLIAWPGTVLEKYSSGGKS